MAMFLCGNFPDLVQRFGKIMDCDLCEWECFRDPSGLLGPFADVFRQPFQLVGKIFKKPRFFQLLLEDLRYYKACNCLNGRLARHYGAMKRFAKR